MKLKNYSISSETVEKCVVALSAHWFDSTGEYNNDEVIDASKSLEKEIKEIERAI